MRKAVLAAGFALVLVVVGVWLLPKAEDGSALAQIANAMSRVDSAHFVGWYTDRESGRRRRLEGWVKGASKLRFNLEGALEEATDGSKHVRIDSRGPQKEAVIGPADKFEPDIQLSFFRGAEAVKFAMQRIRAEVVGSKETVLEDGRKAVVTELRCPAGKALLYTDPNTDLVIKWVQYDAGGQPTTAMERVEYNVDIPDSMFVLAIPKDIPVVDLLTPVAPDKLKWRKAETLRLFDLYGESVVHVGSGDHTSWIGTRYHPGYYFRNIGSGELRVFYLPDENVYRVIGTAQVEGPTGSDFSRVVADGDVRLPGKPHIYEVLMENGRPGAFCRLDAAHINIAGLRPLRFVNVGPGPLTVKWSNAREAVIILGRAKLVPLGDVYNNADGLTASDFGDRLIRLPEPDWDGLPPQEAAIATEELEIERRYRELVDNVRDDRGIATSTYRLGKSAGGAGFGDYVTHDRCGRDFAFERVGPTGPYVVVVPARREYHVIGRARLLTKGKPDRIVRNAVISFGGEVVSTED